MPTNSAVREMLPLKRLICAVRYSRSKTSRASRSGSDMMCAPPCAGVEGRISPISFGSMSAVMTASGSPRVRIISRSTLLRSWRRFPGQSCACSTAIASSPILRSGRPVALESCAHEIGYQLGDVLAPLGKRGHAQRHDAQPMEKVLAEAPFPIAASRSRAVEERTRTSTFTLVAPPTRSKVWSTSTRRILFCVSRGMSAISSR